MSKKVKITDSEGNETILDSLALTENNSLIELKEEDIALVNPEFTFVVGEDYQVQAMANAESLLSSKWSTSFTVKKLQAPTNLNVIRAEEFSYEDGEGNVVNIKAGDAMVTWSNPNEVTARLNYALSYGDDSEETIIYNTSSDGTSELLGQLLLSDKATGTYTLRMRTIGTTTTGTANIGLLSSNYSEDSSPTLNYVANTTNVGMDENGTYTWDSVQGAYMYKLVFYHGMNAKIDDTVAYITYTTTNSYSFKNSEFSDAGYYTLRVTAITDPSVAIVSTHADAVTDNTDNIYKSSNLSQIFVKDGKLAWMLQVKDIRQYISPYVTDENSAIYKYFNGAGESGEEGVAPQAETLTEDELLNEVIDYVMNIVNQKTVKDANMDKLLSHIYNFRLSLNGVETPVVADSLKVVEVVTDNSSGTTVRNYNEIRNNYLDTHYLMFTHDLVIETEEEIKFDINLSPIGNVSSGEGVVTTTDGRYLNSLKLTAYKPLTPKTWVNDDYANQITKGELQWSLVTTADSSPDNFQYHKNYEIVATSSQNKDSKVSVKISTDETYDEENQINTNITDNYNYRRQLTELFTTVGINRISTNINYNLTINVLGTEDSTLLTSTDKIYLNSNKFAFRDHLNILENLQVKVANSVFSWDYCTDSTATKVVIYGPFDYAPNYDEYVEDSHDIEGIEAYNTALKAWKESIASDFADPDKRYEKVYEAKVESGEGGEIIANRITKYSLTKNLLEDVNYPAGSYIIRKQEIGNGKGVIDTPFSDELFISENNPSEPYGAITTKLGMTDTLYGDGMWVEDGMFKWQAVANANAYAVVLQKVNAEGEVLSEKEPIIVRNTYYEMPNDIDYNDISCVYRIKITALRVGDDNVILPNYFQGDELITSAYGRAPIPQDVEVEGTGMVSWDSQTDNEIVEKYMIQINANNNPVGSAEVSKAEKSYSLGNIAENGTISIWVRSLAKAGYLNSCFTPTFEVTKLQAPDAKVINGEFNWLTQSGNVDNQNPANTYFKLLANGELLDSSAIDGVDEGYNINTYNYILNTNIDSYDFDYDLDSERPAGEYTFKVQFKGDSGKVSTTNRQFRITSSELSFNAIKLEAPVLTNLDFDSEDGGVSGNKIRWNKIASADGYRALVFTIDNALVYTTMNDTDFFTINEHSIDLDLQKVVEALEIGDAGVDLKIYVQAIGTLDSTILETDATKYINSSYSKVKSISIPGKPTKGYYNYDAGIVSWDLDSDPEQHAIKLARKNNALVTMTYTVENVTYDEYMTYWAMTSEDYLDITGDYVDNIAITSASNNNAENGRVTIDVADSIITRTINKVTRTTKSIAGEDVTLYTLEVIDVVFIEAKTETPTSYQLTNYGTNYSFSVIITVGDENYRGKYMSLPLEFNTYQLTENSTPQSINFTIFSGGDGSKVLPYLVSNSSEFTRIGLFTTRNFHVIDDIELTENWSMIDADFTGSIDGGYYVDGVLNCHKVTGIVMTSAKATGYEVHQALIRNITSTASIKNLALEINYSISGGSATNMNIKVGGLAITNSGTIDNVHINGSLYVSTGESNGTEVAGLVVDNSGTITNSSVTVGENTDAKTEGIYAFDNNSSRTATMVAGIARTNSGTISNTHFSGDMTSNYVAGIAGDNSGTIDKCYSTGNAYVNDMNASNTTGQQRGIVYGGIAGIISGNATITNSYSTMRVVLLKTSGDKTAYLGGLVGNIVNEDNITITNNYVIVKFFYSDKITPNSIGLSAFYFMPAPADTTNCSDNYYVVESGDNSITGRNDIADNNVVISTTLDGLKENLDETIYDVSGNYPTHK